MARTAAVAVVLVHLAISVIHGAAHSGAGVALSAFQNAFVWVVIMAGPLVALGLIKSRPRLGGALLASTMGGALVFGIVYHFVIVSPDHVSHVASDTWRLPFQVTAMLLPIAEAAGVWVGIRARA